MYFYYSLRYGKIQLPKLNLYVEILPAAVFSA